jgi:hypothetical protein
MHELAVRPGQAHFIRRAERLLVELDRIGRAGADDVRGHGMHVLGNRFHFGLGHHYLLEN